MRLEHVAVWTRNLVRLRDFYVTYFGAVAGERYRNPDTGFESYFLSFTTGARLEIMTRPDLPSEAPFTGERPGYAHMAFSAGSREAVDRLTQRLRADRFTIAGEPRVTGDGYYESNILDPDGNRVEITV